MYSRFGAPCPRPRCGAAGGTAASTVRPASTMGSHVAEEQGQQQRARCAGRRTPFQGVRHEDDLAVAQPATGRRLRPDARADQPG